ncbi:MAG: hypothetical protein K2X90_03905 [Candidatus Babeliaceae bacterium]|nr:hypothetical protein [Candidatus Babeliaceae bacterium]
MKKIIIISVALSAVACFAAEGGNVQSPNMFFRALAVACKQETTQEDPIDPTSAVDPTLTDDHREFMDIMFDENKAASPEKQADPAEGPAENKGTLRRMAACDNLAGALNRYYDANPDESSTSSKGASWQPIASASQPSDPATAPSSSHAQ